MIKSIKRYHPEGHYMRGPGPKWLEKHGGGVGRVDAVMDDTASVCSKAAYATLARVGGPPSTEEITWSAPPSSL